MGVIQHDLTGKQFGELTVLYRSYPELPNLGNHIFYRCLCACGKEKDIRYACLTSGRAKTCYDRTIHKPRKRKNQLFVALNRAENTYINSAKNRQLAWDIPRDEFEELVLNTCYYCGLAATTDRLLGLDRVDNSIGYTVVNCVSCCSRCNYAKGTMTQEEFIEMIRCIYLHQEKIHDRLDRSPHGETFSVA